MRQRPPAPPGRGGAAQPPLAPWVEGRRVGPHGRTAPPRSPPARPPARPSGTAARPAGLSYPVSHQATTPSWPHLGHRARAVVLVSKTPDVPRRGSFGSRTRDAHLGHTA